MQQKEAFLQELQNQIVGKSKRSSPLASSPVLSTPIPHSNLLPFLPYLQQPYLPLPTSDAPWNLQQNMIKEEIEKKSEVNADTPLNLTKPKSNDDQPMMRNSPNDGNNNKNQNYDHAGSSKLLSNPPRLPYNLSNEDPDFFAACRLWPVMAAAVQHNSSPQSQNLPGSMMHSATSTPRENHMMNESNFSGGMSEKQKRDDDKVRIVRQQGGRHRNSSERDLMGKK